MTICISVFQKNACDGDVVTYFMDCYINHRNSSTSMFLLNCSDPRQFFFIDFLIPHTKSSNISLKNKKFAVGRICVATPGMEIGGNIIFFEDYLNIYFICAILFLPPWTFSRPYMDTNYVYEINSNFLEMAHTRFFSSIRKTAYQSSI